MKETIKKLASYVPPTPTEAIARQYGLKRVAKLSANENPYGTSPKVAPAVIEAVKQFGSGNWYPDGNATRLREMIAQKLDVKAANIIFGCGLDEIISLVSRVFLEKGDEVLVAEPTFSEYGLNAQIEGAKVKGVPVDAKTGANDLNGFLKSITLSTRLIWLCNPNNPTGGYNDPNALRDFVAKVPKDILVLIDEAYIDFAKSDQPVSALALLKEFDNVAILRTFSKIYGLAGYRVGYVIMDDQRARYLQTVRLPYNLNTLSQTAAEAALEDQQFVDDVASKNAYEREKWETFLKQHQIFYYPSQANFIFFKVEKADQLAARFLEKGYQVRTGFGNDWLRVTIGLQKDNLGMQQIMAEFLK